MTEIVVIGAGLTGLSVAYHLKNKNYKIFEADRRVGGLCRSKKIKGFVFDYAEHFLRIPNNYVRKVIKKILKNNITSQNLNSSIYMKKVLLGYPFQKHLYGLPEDVIEECIKEFKNALKRSKIKTENFEKWIVQNFGRGIARHFMIPYNKKVWTVHPKNLTTDWFFSESVVPLCDLETVLKGARTPSEERGGMRYYPKFSGIESLIESFLPFINNLNLNKRITKIIPSKKTITINGKGEETYEKLVSTIPLPELVKIIHNVPSEVKKAAKKLMFNSILIVNLGVERKNISDKHWIYFPEDDFIFSRVYFPMNFSSKNTPKNKSSVSSLITYPKGKKINRNGIVKRVIKDLLRAKILRNDDKVIVKDIMDIKYGKPIHTLDRERNLKIIQNFLRKNDIYSIGRYGNWKYSGMEHAIMDGKEIAEIL